MAPLPDPKSEDGVMRERLRVMSDADTSDVAVLTRPLPAMLDFGCVGIMLPPRFAPELVWDADESRLAAAVEVLYDFRLVDGERRLRIRRDLPLREVTREMAVQDIGEEMTVGFGGGRPPCKIPAELVLERQGYASVLPAIGAIALSPDGSIWVRRRAIKDEPRIIDLFDAEGVYLGTLPSDSPFPAAFGPSGDVVAIEKDEMDIDHLVIYRIERGES